MNFKSLLTSLAIVLLSVTAMAAVPQSVSYQGYLAMPNGNPVQDDDYTITFSIYPTAEDPTPLWTSGPQVVTLENGSFEYYLGSSVVFPPGLFANDTTRWLGIQVNPDDEMVPRTHLVSVPYAYKALNADTAGFAFSLDLGTVTTPHMVDGAVTSGKILDGTLTFADIGQNGATTGQVMKWNGTAWAPADDESGGASYWTLTGNALYTNGGWGIARAGNTLHGIYDSTHVNLGAACTTGASGQNYPYATVGGGMSNTASGPATSVGGGYKNRADSSYASVGAGTGNTANGSYATVGGGSFNKADSNYASVAGGRWNFAGDYGSVGGGYGDTASGWGASVSGGQQNIASGWMTTVGGGQHNTASGGYASVGGGRLNTASDTAATVGGGRKNYVAGKYSSIAGGYADTIEATGDYSYLFGIGSKLTQDSTFMVDMPHVRIGDEATGYELPASDGTADQVMATDGAGQLSWSTVSGGGNWTLLEGALYTSGEYGIARAGNTLHGTMDSTHVNLGVACTTGTSGQNAGYSTVGGGFGNTASRYFSTVGGGSFNRADSNYASIAGGRWNFAGDYGSVGGGFGDTASGWGASVGGGQSNIASSWMTTVGGGERNIASGYWASVGGGRLNTASDTAATVGGGRKNFVAGKYSSIAGGYADTITSTGDYSYLFGIGSKLTQDSTFMVDMPHVRFGDEATGYELPTSDGTVDQVMSTDGAGQLSWSTVSGGDGYWTLTGNVLYWNYNYGIARAGNALHGIQNGTHVNLGLASTTGALGQDYQFATVGGGFNNTADSSYSTVSGGHYNSASGYAASVGGGYDNTADSIYAFVGGGRNNTASGYAASVGGGYEDTASGTYSSVGGGSRNTASAGYATVGGGGYNTASGYHASVGGGFNNTASGYATTISGGQDNKADSNWATVGGGYSNTSAGYMTAVGGGQFNIADSGYTTVSGGYLNTATDTAAAVGGGWDNKALSDYAAVGGGRSNRATGQHSTVPGGFMNTASGNYSLAAGRRAKALHGGSFVWADDLPADFSSTASRQFNVRASGGTRIFSNSTLSSGVTLAAGGSSWSAVCDSTLKRNIREVDYQDVLEKVAELPISRWSYKAQDESIEHIGPMAQDFYRLFGLDEDDKHINTLDPDGIALAAIKALNERVKALEGENSQLKTELGQTNQKLDKLQQLVESELAKRSSGNDDLAVNQ